MDPAGDASAMAQLLRFRNVVASGSEMTTKQRTLGRLIFIVGVATLVPTVTTACRLLGAGRADLPTQTDRLMNVYPELRAGRFEVIADFEDPRQMELFRVDGAGEDVRCGLDKKRGRLQTGKTCLRFSPRIGAETLVVSNDNGGEWFLPGDWRAYDTLMMSVRALREPTVIDIEIASGEGTGRIGVGSSVDLARGWNTVRIDLGEIADRVPLGSVREIRLSVPDPSPRTELFFDDLLLTRNRYDVFGDPEGRDGSLYVQQVGRRYRVGAGGRFELTFAHGQIVAWHDLSVDPYRLVNFAQGTVLGPNPLWLRQDDLGGQHEVGTEDYLQFGEEVRARQVILEASNIRVVVLCEWHFTRDASTAPETVTADRQPDFRCVYAVYPTGQVFIAVDYEMRRTEMEPHDPALSIALSAHPPFASAHISEHPARGGDGSIAYITARGRRREGPLIMFAVFDPNGTVRTAAVEDAERRVMALTAIRPAGQGPRETWFAQILLARSADHSDAELAQRAADLGRPVGPQIQIGSMTAPDRTTDTSPDAGLSLGCYDVYAEAGRARFVLDGSVLPFHTPTFRILGGGGRNAWIYVNHLIFDRKAQDAAGNLIFQLSRVVSDRTLIEILFREPHQQPQPAN